MQDVKKYFWQDFTFEQKFLLSFGRLFIDAEGIPEPGFRREYEPLQYFIFKEGILLTLNGYYPSETPNRGIEKTKIRWIEKSQLNESGPHSLWLKSIEDLAETRPFEWSGELKSLVGDKPGTHTKTVVGMQITQQIIVCDDLPCYAYPADELPQESRAKTSEEVHGLSLQFSEQGCSAYFTIEPLNRGYGGSYKFELIPQTPSWHWSRKPEFYREARLSDYDLCLMKYSPGPWGIRDGDLRGRECIMYGIRAHELIASICSVTMIEYWIEGNIPISAKRWYRALKFWNSMKESDSWEDFRQKVARSGDKKASPNNDMMNFFKWYPKDTWGVGWEAAEYFFDWLATILPTCDTVTVEGL